MGGGQPMKKKCLWVFLLYLLAMLTFLMPAAHALTLTTFSDGSNSGNFTFTTGTEWYTRNLLIPPNAKVNNAYMFLNGYNVSNETTTDIACNKAFAADTCAGANMTSSAAYLTTSCASAGITCPTGVSRVIWDDSPYSEWSQYNFSTQYYGSVNITITMSSGLLVSNAALITIVGKNSTTGLDSAGIQTATDGCVAPTTRWIAYPSGIELVTCTSDTFYSFTFEMNQSNGTYSLYTNGVYKTTQNIARAVTNISGIEFAAGTGQDLYVSNISINGTNIANSSGGSQLVTTTTYTYPRNVTLILNNQTVIFNYGATNTSVLDHRTPANFTAFMTTAGRTYPQNISFRSNQSGILEYSGLYVEYKNYLNITIYDESTFLPLSGQNFTIEILNGTAVTTYYTTNASLLLYDNWDGTFTISVFNTNYSRRDQVVTFSGGESINASFYLANQTSSTIFTIQDRLTGQVITDALIEQSRLIGGSYVVVFSKLSDVSGKAQFYYEPNVRYLFEVSKDGYQSKSFFLDPIVFSTYTVQLDKTSTSFYSLDYDDVKFSMTPQDFYNNIVNNVTFQVFSPTNILSQYAITLTYPGGSNTSSGSASAGESFLIRFFIDNAGLFDTVNVTFNYNTTTNATRSFTYQFLVKDATIPAFTWAANRGNTQGSGHLERAIIAVLAVIIIMGFTLTIAGPLAAGVMGLFTFGGFFYIGWLPFYSIVPALAIGLVLLATRSSE